MRICIDMDGCLTEGRYLPAPRTKLDYMSLAPYDADTARYAQAIFEHHDCYIITGRSDEGATATIVEWLASVLGIRQCYISIITNPRQNTTSTEVAKWKYELALKLGCQLILDDNPTIIEHANRCTLMDGPECFLVNNPDW